MMPVLRLYFDEHFATSSANQAAVHEVQEQVVSLAKQTNARAVRANRPDSILDLNILKTVVRSKLRRIHDNRVAQIKPG